MLTASIPTGTSTGIPTIDIYGRNTGVEYSQTTLSLDQLSAAVHQALTQYPYYTVVNGFSPMKDPHTLETLACAIRAKISPRTETNREHLNPVSFTEVYVARESLEVLDDASSEFTQVSRTRAPLPPHTDSSYEVLPHEMVIFHCIKADEGGGNSLMIPAEDVLQRLDDDVIARLREPVYPFGRGRHAILCGDRTTPFIRYYQIQLEHTSHLKSTELSAEHRSALKALNAVLCQEELCHKFHLKPGQILFMHNQKVFHGRTALSTNADRLMYRMRLHVSSLSADEQIFVANDAPTHMTLAKELSWLGRLERALYHYQQASELAPEQPNVLEAYGSFLLETGQFERAASVLRQCLMLNPAHYNGGLALSGLAKAAGDEIEAQAVLNPIMRAHPFVFEAKPTAEKLTVLRMQGIEGSAYGIVESSNGRYSPLLRSGHFSVSNLLSHDDYNPLVLNIFEDNIATLEDIPQFDLMLNTIACADSRAISLLAATRFVERYSHLPVINHPGQVLETTRDRNSHRLNSIEGVTFPKTEKFWWDRETVDGAVTDIVAWGFKFPMIIRKVQSHTGKSVVLLNDESALRTHLLTSSADNYYAIQYQDCSIRPGIYEKMRIFFIDGVLYPVANIFNDHWAIHSGDRYSVMDKETWMREEEQTFLNDPVSYLGSENFSKLYAIRDLVKLDFFGIDFVKLNDGSLFIFELNAAMRHNFDHAKNFPYTKPHLKSVSAAFDQMVKERLKGCSQES